MFALYKLYPGLLSSETCEEIIECAKKLSLNDATVTRNKVVDRDYRSAKITFIDKCNEDFTEIYKFVEDKVYEANVECFGVNLTKLQKLQFSEYSSDDKAHFDMHMDTFFDNRSFTQRKLTICFQLSDPDDYEGGNFEFYYKTNELDLFRQRGSILIFASFLPHRVTQVTKGSRCSLVGWYEGNRWQ